MSRQVHETLNGVNPSTSFRDMRSQSLDPICGKFDKFLAHGQADMGQMGKWPWQCTTTGLDNSTERRTEKIHQAVTEIWVPQVWQPPARPPAWTVTTIPLQLGGLRGKNENRLPRERNLKCHLQNVVQGKDKLSHCDLVMPWCQKSWLPMVPVNACHPFDVKSIPEPMLTYCQMTFGNVHIEWKFLLKIKTTKIANLSLI